MSRCKAEFALTIALLIVMPLLAADAIQDRASAPQKDFQRKEKAYVDSAGNLHVLDRGTYITIAKEKGQLGSSSLKVTEDKRTIGWTAEYKNCCTSYDIPLLLVIYRDGRVRQRLGNGMMIYDWRFWDGGNKVAFCSGTVHGAWPGHCELHDSNSGRLLATIDGRLSSKSPAWTRGLQNQ